MKKLFVLLVMLGAAVAAQAARPAADLRIKDFFKAWDQDPKAVMNSLPKKYDRKGKLIKPNSKFSAQDVASGRYKEIKMSSRSKYFKGTLRPVDSSDGIAVDQANNPVPMLLASRKGNINALGEQTLNQGRVSVDPWSGDYWATYRAGIAVRYQDPSYPTSTLWSTYESFFEKAFKVPFTSMDKFDNLSPAEKYDLLVGDNDRTLTKWSVSNSRDYVENGTIQTWMGICHGWAPAAYMTRVPKKEVSFKTPSGKDLKFYPDDVKALMTLLWANVEVPTSFVGSRCNEKNPKTDPVTGRILSNACWDVNPMSWHITMLNRVGVDKSSFVMDATWDYEVWNHPIQSYEVTYFNPQTRQTYKTLKEAAISLSQFTKNKFPKRAAGTQSVVGVMMDTTFAVESSATHFPDPGNEVSSAEYVYDLEIDGTGKILGGEWYQNAHPDFVWTPAQGSKPVTQNEVSRPVSWSGAGLPDSQVRPVAVEAAGQGNPLSAIVYKLLDLSVSGPQ